MYLNGATKNEQFMWVGTYAIARRYNHAIASSAWKAIDCCERYTLH